MHFTILCGFFEQFLEQVVKRATKDPFNPPDVVHFAVTEVLDRFDHRQRSPDRRFISDRSGT